MLSPKLVDRSAKQGHGSSIDRHFPSLVWCVKQTGSCFDSLLAAEGGGRWQPMAQALSTRRSGSRAPEGGDRTTEILSPALRALVYINWNEPSPSK
jgi:hypothetical protein